MKKHRQIKTSVSALLCAALLLPYSAEAFAETVSTGEPTLEITENLGENETVSDIITELNEKRTETSKTFLLDNGTMMIADYNLPVHFKDDKGEWTDYDNSLVISEDEAIISAA